MLRVGVEIRSMLTWSPEFATGVAEVDSDHQQLITSLNQLELALKAGEGSKHITVLLKFLEDYANIHFSREEACMHRLQCPTSQLNIQAHAQFRTTFARAKERLVSPMAGPLVAVQVHRELCDWVVKHIMRVDSGLKQCARGGAPAGART